MKHILSLLLCIFSLQAWACTSVIVSGDRTTSGRPMLYKHRDTKALLNEVNYFEGAHYRYIGLTNSTGTRRSVWAGTNETGFSIMNTASYNLKDDTISEDLMGLEGKIMAEALGQCASVDEFETFLFNHSKPLYVETNFGVIDAHGGAAYFEVNNEHYIRYNVADAPGHYMVVTNYSQAGREADRKGVERKQTADAIMQELAAAHPELLPIDHTWFVNNLSRSYRHELLGTTADFCPESGIAVDQDFIPRRLTSAVVIIEGVRYGENPLHTVMWTEIGYPACGVTVPLMLGPTNILPAAVQHGEKTSAFCQTAMNLKKHYVFPWTISSGQQYFRIDAIQKGTEGRPALKACAQQAEKDINALFTPLFDEWTKGNISDSLFYKRYRKQSQMYYSLYTSAYQLYLSPLNDKL